MILNAPLQFTPILMTRVWGGERLKSRVAAPPPGPVGESWEICDRVDGRSVVRAGAWAGRSLRELFTERRAELCGRAIDPASPGIFPLMLKLLDPVSDLSVQVHPDDAYAGARRPGELGKTEAWYVLWAAPDAVIYRGFKPGVTPGDFRRALADGSVASLLKALPARAGDVFYLPAGTVHARGAGARIAEIQQNSDTTYRVFDWNRVGLDGRPRELHIDDALAVSDLAGEAGGPDYARPLALPQEGCLRQRHVQCGKFTLDRLHGFVPGTGTVLDTKGMTFHIVTAARGRLRLAAPGGAAELEEWDSALVPAAAGAYRLEADAGGEALLFGGGV